MKHQYGLLKIRSLAAQILEIADGMDFVPTPTDALGLSSRASNCLERKGIKYIEQLLKYDMDELMRIRNMGKHTANEIISKVNQFGIKWLAEKLP